MAVPCKKLCQRWSTTRDSDLDLEQFDPSDLTSMASVQVMKFLAFLGEEVLMFKGLKTSYSVNFDYINVFPFQSFTDNVMRFDSI